MENHNRLNKEVRSKDEQGIMALQRNDWNGHEQQHRTHRTLCDLDKLKDER